MRSGWALALLLLQASGCDDSELGVDDGGVACGGDDGGADGWSPPVDDKPYPFVWILDTSLPEYEDGAAGVDICGLSSECGRPTMATISMGAGEVCDGVGCPVDRRNPTAALDDGAACAADSAPSDYVSLGGNGLLSVQFGVSLVGCSLSIVELDAGGHDETFEVYVCDGPSAADNCLNNGIPLATGLSGTVQVQVQES